MMLLFDLSYAIWRRSRDVFFFFSSRRRHTRLQGDWSSDVCSSDLGDRGGGTPQRQSRRFPPDRVTQQWDRQCGNVAAAGVHTSCALCAVLRNLHGDTLAEVGKPRKRAGGRRQPGPFPPCSIISTSARICPRAWPSSRLFTRISASI